VEVVFYIEIGGGGVEKGGTAHVGSFGEREHALSFARQIAAAGYRPRFVVGPLIADHIQRAGFEPEVFWSPGDGVEIVRKIDPGLIVGCELFNISPRAAEGLIALGRPMATIDGTSLSVPINTDPFGLPQYARALVLPDHYYAFRPCPVNDLQPDSPDVFHWSLFPNAGRASKDIRRYELLGLDPSRLTVMLPIAPWAMGSAMIFGLEGYYPTLIASIVDGLDGAGAPADLVVISPVRPDSPIDARGDVRVHYPGLMPYDVYDHLLCSCDVIVTDNMISTSVSKAVVMGIPHLIIQNMQPSELPYRCNMFPLKVLFPPERDYAQIVDVAEYGDADGIRAALDALVRRGYDDEDARRRRRGYVDGLRQLSSPSRILEQVLGRPESVGTRAR
jgi:hypothetical protein